MRTHSIGTRSLALALLALQIGLSVALASPASAETTSAGAEAAALCRKQPARDDDTIHITGCLKDLRETPPAAVPGVGLSVEDSGGKNIGTGTSDRSGTFDIPLPGEAIDNLGKGASGAAVQCMNLHLGLEESLGL